MRISPLDLKLDTSNPRFLNVQLTEADAIKYLLKWGKIIELARSICDSGGLYIGERIVAVDNHDGTFTVVEGNRRTCACKLLLSPDLAPPEKRSLLPTATPALISSLSQIEVDVVDSLADAERFVAARHTEGVLLWSPIAKAKFFADRLDSGQSIGRIADTTRTSVTKVKRAIQDYRLLMHGLGLSCWSQSDREKKLNPLELDSERFLRIFRTKGALLNFGMTFDSAMHPTSNLGAQALDQIIQRIMYCAFVTDDNNEKINTRTRSWEEVPGLKEIVLAARGGVSGKPTASNNPDASAPPATTSAGPHGTSSTPLPAVFPVATGSTKPARPVLPTHNRRTLIPHGLNLNIDQPKLRNIYSELQRLDVHSYTNVAAIAFRVFFELTIDEYLVRNNLPRSESDSLRTKLKNALSDLQQKGLLSTRDAGTYHRLTSEDGQEPQLFSITNFHDYVHRRHYQAIPRELFVIWDNIQPLMQLIYG